MKTSHFAYTINYKINRVEQNLSEGQLEIDLWFLFIFRFDFVLLPNYYTYFFIIKPS